MAIVGLTVHNFSEYRHQLTFDHNVYFSPHRDLSAAPGITPLGGWQAWQRAGWDVNSAIADPMFVDAAGGYFGLKTDSPALKVGFVPLPPGIDRC